MNAIGIDTHKATLAACRVDDLGTGVAEATFANDPAGHRRLLDWIRESDPAIVVGIEGSASFGAAAARSLVGAGVAVREVPPQLTRRERVRTRRLGKSDPGDAVAIARVTAREHDLPPVRLADRTLDLQLLVEAREDVVVEMTRVRNRLHADLRSLVPGYGSRASNLVAARHQRLVGRLLRTLTGVQAELARRRLARLRALGLEERAFTARIAGLVQGHPLLGLPGVGPLMTAKLVGEIGDVRRFRSADALAALAGVAPIPASSGQTLADASQPRRQPPTEPGLPRHRHGAGQPSPAGPDIPRPQTSRGQDPPRGPPGPQKTTRPARRAAPGGCSTGQPGSLTR